jgi:hypothetical protein
MEFKPAYPAAPKPGSAASVIQNPPAPPAADGKRVVIGKPSGTPPPHVIPPRTIEPTPVKKQYMWQLRRARGEKF